MFVDKKEETQPREKDLLIADYRQYVRAREFPCVAAKAAFSKEQIQCMVASHLACPKDDRAILDFLYAFVDHYRRSDEMYHSAAIIFQQPTVLKEEAFDDFLWQRLQSLSSMDAANFGYDARVDVDPASPNFSYSLKEEAFFIIGLHPGSSRTARQFSYPTLVFNPHRQFEQLKETAKYQRLKHVVRKRDIAYSGSVNPMLEDFGAVSEVYQYSGRRYNKQWQCPLKINHVTA